MLKKSILAIALILMGVCIINAQVPQLINYQGYLTDAAGNKINGSRSIQFSIYDLPSGGTPIWWEIQPAVTISDGLFNVLLGSVTPIPYTVFNGSDKYLSLKVESDPEMTPRKRLVSVGYSFRSNDANNVTGTGNVFPSSGNVGIGTKNPGFKLEVTDLIGITGTGGNEGGQLSLIDGDGKGGWEMDNFGPSGDEALRFFRGRGFNDVFHALVLRPSGNVGVGTVPGEKFQVNGIIHSMSGGFKFPDGSVQEKACSGGLSLPYSGTIANAGLPAFSISNTGYGHAIKASTDGAFDITGKHFPSAAVYGEATNTSENATNWGGFFMSKGGNGTGVYGGSTGKDGYGILGEANGANSSAIRGINSGGGQAGLFQITNPTNTSSTIKSTTNGMGRAGFFQITNVNNATQAILANTDGTGEAIYATTYGTGRVVFIGINNVNNNSNALEVITNGTGRAAYCNVENSNNAAPALEVRTNGKNWTGYFAGKGANAKGVFIGTDSPNQPALQVSGRTITKVLEITGGSDVAEPFEISNAEAIQPGMVVAIDPEQPGRLRMVDKAYDRTVAGVVSGAHGINPGLILKQEDTVANGSLPVALTGRVYCWVDASYGSIEPGDLLTTSDTPGHAMKVCDYERSQGAVIGKAMSSLREGRDLVLVLVTLQ